MESPSRARPRSGLVHSEIRHRDVSRLCSVKSGGMIRLEVERGVLRILDNCKIRPGATHARRARLRHRAKQDLGIKEMSSRIFHCLMIPRLISPPCRTMGNPNGLGRRLMGFVCDVAAKTSPHLSLGFISRYMNLTCEKVG